MPSDDDCDDLRTASETQMSTDPMKRCAATPGVNDESGQDAWPPDSNDDQRAGLADILNYISVFNMKCVP